MKYRILLSIEGQAPTFLGTFNELDAVYLADIASSFGIVDVYEDSDLNATRAMQRMRANPTTMNSPDITDSIITKALKKPLDAFRGSPLNFDRCSVGRPEMLNPQEEIFPVNVQDVSDISMDEVAAHLGAFIPNCRKVMPVEILEIFESGDRYIPESVYSKVNLDIVKKNLIESVLRQNTKMSKAKIPSTLGIGKPVGDGLSEAPTAGSIGLSFLPNYTLLRTSADTKEKGFRQIIQQYAKRKFVGYTKRDKDTKTQDKQKRELYATQLSILLANETLETVKGNACVSASKGCRKACLVNSGQRYATQKDTFGEKTKDFDVMQNRMLLGFWQTAFIANPFYFLRLLIEAIYHYGVDHEIQLAKYNLEAKYLGNKEDLVDADKYLKVLPLSVRLNVYTDYPWEIIYPDVFNMFNLKSPKGFVEKDLSGSVVKKYNPLRVQFYDYTKISGRWTAQQRKSIWKKLGVDIPNRLQNSLKLEDEFVLGDMYQLPDNYHITFSFNGTDSSRIESLLANNAGQNATFVFASQQLINATFLKLIEEGNVSIKGFKGKALAKELKRFNKEFSNALRDVLSEPGVLYMPKTVREGDELPHSYMGYDVISGDTYDLRFLDVEMQKALQGKTRNLESVIVGLKWKTPSNLKLRVAGNNYEMTPINAAALTQSLKKVTGDPTIAEGFAQSRVGLGVGLDTDQRGGVSLYILAEDSSLEKTEEILRDLVSLSQEEITTFATETGRVINDGASPEEISEFLSLELNRILTDAED